MAYAYCLKFDEETEAAVSAVWHALAERGASDDMLRLGYPPHLSLAVMDEELPLERLLSALEGLAPSRLPIQLGGARQFPDTEIVWLACDGGVGLADLHRRLLARLPAEVVRDHYLPGNWVPHVTLQTAGPAAVALPIANECWPSQRDAVCVALELVRFPLIEIRRSVMLG